MSKYLGIDWGEKKIGLALGSSGTGLALPHKIINNDEAGLEYIKKICREEEADIVVVGIPKINENGKWKIEGGLEKFIEKLKGLEGTKLELTDERLTTKMAGKLNRDLGNQDDAVAAQMILQGFLDKKARNTNS